ncbi:S8 family serine peptidase [Nonomuraea aridisoli]|uniref:Peptidase S8 n=1 Tax=Nonomuraea aridisoli TaxID=2070368 RepID=A0A2W2F4K9_9ACTN|nr:S8 family serine peptidase [Nonomuraea aridisoli]PZG19978.1 peptidase S8 [Nonomuraea aridisoli]
MRVLIQLRPSPDLVSTLSDPRGTVSAADVAGGLPGVELDTAFTPVTVPRPAGDPLTLRPFDAAEDACVLVRGTLCDDRPLGPGVTVHADPAIEAVPVRAGGPPIGDWHDVERLLNVAGLHAEGLDGDGVALAVLDTGIDGAHTARRLGRSVTLDAGSRWNGSARPGESATGHGTMSAFDALIAAPHATLVDLPVLPPGRGALLSDALSALAGLLTALETQPEESRALVVVSGWTVATPTLPAGYSGSTAHPRGFPGHHCGRTAQPGGYPGDAAHPGGRSGEAAHLGCYSDDAAHPVNLMIAALDRAGADVVFAAGDHGRPIAGACSHPKALSVGAVDVNGDRLGYSSRGPGRLTARKPDVCAYAHFAGSGAFGPDEPDAGTAAAAAVTAGLVAAVRTRWPASRLPPAELRALLRRTAEDRSEAGFDYDYGYGSVDPAGIIAALQRRARNAA